ncbi:MAG: FkbM family methyltransferase [Rhodobacteraceae bacterium]|nr:FkbM family methyltransferase [Paracoccaceae bacterium]
MTLLHGIARFDPDRGRRNRNAVKTIILRALSHARKDDVFCIQVGANDGKLADPIHGMITANGWTGLLIEPHPAYYRDLVALYADTPGIRTLNVGISDQEATLPLYHLAEDARGLYPAWARGCASLDESWMSAAIDRACDMEGITREDHHLACVDVPLVRLDGVLKDHKITRADILVVDVEGHEPAVMRSFDLDALSASVVIIECKSSGRRAQGAHVAQLEKAGFDVFRLSGDLYGVHRDRMTVPLSDMLQWIGYDALVAPGTPA